MLSAFVRGICCSDQLLRAAVKRALARHRTAFLSTWVWSRVGQGFSHDHVLRPEIGYDGVKRSFWVPSSPLRSEKSENRSSQVPVQSKKGDVSLSAAQKGKEGETLLSLITTLRTFKAFPKMEPLAMDNVLWVGLDGFNV